MGDADVTRYLPRRSMAAKQQSDSNVGKVIENKGVVLDVVFPGQLPEMNNALEIQLGSNGDTSTLVAEVQQHLRDDRVRGDAMDWTDGLERGVAGVESGRAI